MDETRYTAFFTPAEWELKSTLEARLVELAGDSLREDDLQRIETLLAEAIEGERLSRDSFGLNPIINNLQTAIIVVDEMGMRRAAIVSILLHDVVKNEYISTEEVDEQFGSDGAGILRGLVRTGRLY
jgi:GTP pyrophosphokinase